MCACACALFYCLLHANKPKKLLAKPTEKNKSQCVALCIKFLSGCGFFCLFIYCCNSIEKQRDFFLQLQQMCNWVATQIYKLHELWSGSVSTMKQNEWQNESAVCHDTWAKWARIQHITRSRLDQKLHEMKYERKLTLALIAQPRFTPCGLCA